MKKRVFTVTVIVFAFLANVSAQLTVDSTGRVGIGTEIPQFNLDINGDTRVTKGSIYLGDAFGFLGTINNDPVRFKVGHDLAGNTGTAGNRNVSFGYKALSADTMNHYNTAIGFMVLSSNTIGSYNTAIGERALCYNTTGNYNTAIGRCALYSNTTGRFNTAIGLDALYYDTTGIYNTAIGYRALVFNRMGNDNTAIGNSTLETNTVGMGNTAIGSGADVITNNLSNATAIGYKALATLSNQVRIGNYFVTSIGGHVTWTVFPDKRIERNIRMDVPGLAFINRLQPVTFNLDLDAMDELLKIDKTKSPDERELSPELEEITRKAKEAKEKVKQTGFIAQDVEEAAKSIGYDFSGVDVDEAGIYGLRYAEFVVPLVKAVQELSDHNNRLQTQNDRLQAQIDELSATVRQLSEKTGNANNFNETGGE